ncbi:unnamed protein product [Hapterophycus canaliculatus]
MERRGPPLRLLLEACSFIFATALRIAGGDPTPAAASPASPTLPFKGGVEGDGDAGVAAALRGKGRAGGDRDGGAAAAAAAAASGSGGGGAAAGVQEGWEAFNRSMDDRDQEVLAAATAGAAAAGAAAEAAGGRRERVELPPAMLEALKVALSLLRRLSNRNLTAAGPFASTMHMWPSGHPQVRGAF